MAALIQDFEYDIFISYRHNDNLDGWVTDFVQSLERELKATVKESLTIYFDRNPHDGLLETHHVDKSLEGKLKCLIFIPILSQTYCDPKSFAWTHEFCAFNRLSKSDKFGRDIKLSNGNVSSRILPIRIHDLDIEDRSMIEKEIGGALRAIEFIYKEPGVNRPLKPGDNKNDSQNKTDYRNQINKVANAVKDLLHALEFPTATTSPMQGREFNMVPTKKNRRRMMLVAVAALTLGLGTFVAYYFGGLGNDAALERTIAVLPFDNMNRDPEQDYFSSGMTEDILNHLTKIRDLQVKSRTSTMQYKGTTKTVSEIGEELGVSNVVEGSVRKVGDKVRIVVQLIDAKRDVHLWSETYDRDLKDVLNLQSEIAMEIAAALKARLSDTERRQVVKEVTQDITAYDYFLRAREKLVSVKYDKNSFIEIRDLLNRAIGKDPNFAAAYAAKAEIWFELSYFGLSMEACMDSAFASARRSIALNPEAPDGHLVLASINNYLGRFKEYEQHLKTAYKVSPGNLKVGSMYGDYLLDQKDETGADLIIKTIGQTYSSHQPEYYNAMVTPYFFTEDFEHVIRLREKLKELNPTSTQPYLTLGRLYLFGLKDYEKAKSEANAVLKMIPNEPIALDILAWTAYHQGDYNKAVEVWRKRREVESDYEDSTQSLPFRHREAMALIKLGRRSEAVVALKEEIAAQNQILRSKWRMGTWSSPGGTYYSVAVCHALLGQDALAVQNLDSAISYRFYVKGLYENDPAFEKIKDTPSFRKVQARLDNFYGFRKRAFMKALNRNKEHDELKNLLNR